MLCKKLPCIWESMCSARLCHLQWSNGMVLPPLTPFLPGPAAAITGLLDQSIQRAGNRPRQTVLLSATLPAGLGDMASINLQNAVSVGFQ